MKFLIVHNRYSRPGGEESMVAFQQSLLGANGHEVMLYERAHDEIRSWPMGRTQSFFTALHNPQAVRELEALVQAVRPDVAIVHNLFPVISPAILPMLKRHGIRVLMTLHNFRLICPIGLFYAHGAVCERCGSSFWREGNCLERQCEGSIAGSAAFAARGFWSRTHRYYLDNVDGYLVQTAFHRDKLVQYGLPFERFHIVPNAIDPARMPAPSDGLQRSDYVGYAGRLSGEKGVDLLMELAARRPGVRFRVAGDFASDRLRRYWQGRIPTNVELLGRLSARELADFYAAAAAAVMTSRCYETFGLSLAEAMYYSTPVVAPDLAGPPEVVDHGHAGLLYRSGNAADLAAHLDRLLGDSDFAARLGARGRERIASVYSPQTYAAALLAAATVSL